VTIIEVALIVSVMITGAGDSPANSQFGYLQGA
jgi:hypothetical protein